MKWLGTSLRSARWVVFTGAAFLLFLGGLLWRPAPAGAVLIIGLSTVPIFIDGQKIDVPEIGGGVIVQNRTLVPIRFVAEHLGGEVTWDEDRRVGVVIIAGADGEKVIEVPATGNQARVNGRAVPLDVGARIIQNRVFVPLRFISDAFGAIVEWKGEERQVHIARTGKPGAPGEGVASARACAYGTEGLDYGYDAVPVALRCLNARCPGGPLIYLAGSASDGSSTTNLASKDDALLVRLDGQGRIAATKTFGRRGLHESFRAAAYAGDGGLVLVGTANGPVFGRKDSSARSFICKVDGDGSLVWTRALEDDRSLNAGILSDIAAAPDGGFFVVGSGGPWPYGPDALVLKLDATGNIVWRQAFRGRDQDGFRRVVATRDGGVLAVGFTSSGGSSTALLAVKLDASGQVEWQRSWGPGSQYMAFSATEASDGGYVVVGRGPGTNGGGAFILKLDAWGDSEWQLSFDGNGADHATAVASTEDGYLVAGDSSSFGSERLLLLKVDETGRLLSKKVFGGGKIKGFTRATSLVTVPGGGFILTGTAELDPFGPDVDVLALRLDADGDIPGCDLLQNVSGGTVSDPGLIGNDAGLELVVPDAVLNEAPNLRETSLSVRASVLCAAEEEGQLVTVQGILRRGVECPYRVDKYTLHPHAGYSEEYKKLAGYIGQEVRVAGYAYPGRPTTCMEGIPLEVIRVELVSTAPTSWRESEDFQTGDPRQRWRFEQGGCVPTSSRVAQYIDGYLRQAAEDGGMDGHDCVLFAATRDFALPAGFQVDRLDLKVSWRVPRFTTPGGPHGGKEGYADLMLIPLDGQGKELGRLRYRVSGDDRSGYGTRYLDPPSYGMNDGSKVVLVHGQGAVPNWQVLSVRPSSDLSLDWRSMRALRVRFEFAAGYMYSDEWTVDWDNLELLAFGPTSRENILGFLNFLDKKFGKEYGQLIEQLKSAAQENDMQRYKTLGNQFADVLRRDHPELLTYCTDSRGCGVAGVGCCWCWPTPHPDCGGGWFTICFCVTPPGVPGGGGGGCGSPPWICGMQ